MWVALAALLVAIGAIGATVVGSATAPRDGARGVARFSLAAVSRPSSDRRVLELRGPGGSIRQLGTRGAVAGVSRAGDRLLIGGSAADDTLIVDFTHGNPVPPGGLVYDGAGHHTRVGNVLVIRGGHFHRDVYDLTSSSSGAIHLDRTTITYKDLQPVANTGSAADAVFSLPAGANDAALQDDGTPGNHKSELFSASHRFETTTFTNPSSSLTIQGGGASDTLTLNPSDSFNSADVTVSSEGTVAANSLSTGGALRIVAGSVNQAAGALHVGQLGASTAGALLLTQPNNSIKTIAGSVSGPATVVSSPLSVGSVTASGQFPGADGLSASGGDVSLSTSGKLLVLSRAVSASNGKLTATCGTRGIACTIDASGGSLNGEPVTLTGGSGTNTFDLTDEDTTGTGPLIVDGAGTGTATITGSSVSQSPDSGLILRNLASATVTGGNFSANAKEGILVQNTASATLGGGGTGQPNVVSGNGTNGFTIASGSGIQLVRNAIFANGNLGISLQGGANHGQSAPTLTASAPSGAGTHVTGSLQSTPGHSFRIEFFDNPACDASGFGEGRTFIGSADVTTSASGNASFDLTLPGGSASTDAVAATASDLATGDTSQFSRCIPPSPPTVSVTAPGSGATYTRGQLLRAGFTCTDGARGPGIALCLPIGNDGPFVDTRATGKHTFTVVALSRDGLVATQAINYAVVPPLTVSRKRLNRTTGVVTFDVGLQGPGTVKAVETMLSAGRQFVAGRARSVSRRRQTLHVRIKPNPRALRLVRHHLRLVSIQIVVTFTPTGGSSHSIRFALALPAPPARRA